MALNSSHPSWRALGLLWLILMTAPTVAMVDQELRWDLKRSDWPEKPEAIEVIRLQPLTRLYKHYRNERAKIEIRYPGGSQGRQWATEVRGWLVTFGIPMNDIVLSVGVDSPDRLHLALIREK